MSILYVAMPETIRSYLQQTIANKINDYFYISRIEERCYEENCVTLTITFQLEGITDKIDGFGEITIGMEKEKFYGLYRNS